MGTRAELLDDYVGSIDAMIADIDAPRRYVHVEFFILVYDDTTAPLLRRPGPGLRRRGVTVRVLSDHVAQYSYPNRKKTLKVLEEMGAEYRPMLPLQPFRVIGGDPICATTASCVVVDGVIGHAGSQNMIIDHYHKKANIQRGLHWHELMARFHGPVVRELDAVFVTDWYSETQHLLPSGQHAGRARARSRAIWTVRSSPADPASRTTTTSSCSRP